MNFKHLSTAAFVAAAMAAGSAYAGDNNTAYIEQIGTGNSANVNQATGPGDNDVGTMAGDNNDFNFSNAGCCNANNRFNNDVAKAEQIGDGNWMNIGVGNLSNNNLIGDAQQQGNDNRLLIVQNGSRTGTITTVLQDGNVNSAVLTQNGNNNTITNVRMTGDDNGYTNTLSLAAGRFASLRIRQSGNSNEVSNATLEGNNNRQIPSNLTAPLLDINQDGDGNAAFGNMLGSDGNFLNINQVGNDNDAGVDQGTSIASTGNDADVDQLGDGNYVRVDQDGSFNTANLSFTGNDNGSLGFTGGGDAAGLGLTQGNVIQDSSSAASGNTIDYTVLGNANLFAFSQIGGGNTISGTVGSGMADSDNNEVAVLQNGDGNTASFSQSGAGSNNLAISQ